MDHLLADAVSLMAPALQKQRAQTARLLRSLDESPSHTLHNEDASALRELIERLRALDETLRKVAVEMETSVAPRQRLVPPRPEAAT